VTLGQDESRLTDQCGVRMEWLTPPGMSLHVQGHEDHRHVHPGRNPPYEDPRHPCCHVKSSSLSRVPAQHAPHSHFSEDNEPRIRTRRRECKIRGSSSSVRSNEVLPAGLTINLNAPRLKNDFHTWRVNLRRGVPEV